MELSVIIVSYNVREYLKRALISVTGAAREIDNEIIVVDNHSTDGSDEMIRHEFHRVKLIVSYVNEGFSAACNRGIQSSSGDFILILNPDTVVAPEALTRALAFMHSHAEAGAAGARLTDGNGKFLPESKRGFPSPVTSLLKFSGMGRLFPHSSFFNAYYLGHLPENEVCRADILTGAFMLIRREALNAAGTFDTGFFLYGEDIDMSWRIRKAGYYNYYLPDVHVVHFKGKSSETEIYNSVKHFYGAMKIFAVKHLKRVWHLPVKSVVTIMEKATLASMQVRQLIKK
jgi:GT2 family glycosyltransferase